MLEKKEYYSAAVRRREIIAGRLRGESTSSLASRMGVSTEYVSKTYRGLPKRPDCSRNDLFVREMPADEATICSVCIEYLDGASEESLIRKYGMTRENLFACFYAVSDRIACYNMNNQQRFAYGIIVRKRNELNLSLTVLAQECGHTLFTLKEILKGWTHMPFNVADTLTKILGITVSELWDDAIVPDAAKKNLRKKDELLLQRRAMAHYIAAVHDDSQLNFCDAIYWVYYRYTKKSEVCG